MQPHQPIKKPNKFSWFKIVLIGLLIALIAYIIYEQFFKSSGTIISPKGLYKHIKKINNLKIKIKEVSYDEMYRLLYITLSNNEKYLITGLTQPEVNSLFYNSDIPGLYNGLLSIEEFGVEKGLKFNIGGTPPSFVWSLIRSLLPMILLIGFWMFMMRSQYSMGDMFKSKNIAQKVVSNKRFSDVAGQEEAKEEVSEVVDFLKHPHRYNVAGARIPKGIILGGPPGTGKTLLAKATAGEAGVLFFSISGSGFVEMFAGLGAKRVRELFQEARKFAPAILFIDEIDAIGRKRGGSFSGNDEREQTLNQILTELDGMQENNGLIVMAATNRLDVLDEALLRPGRFDRSITLRNPDIKERKAILELHARGKRISSEVDFENIAKRTPGYSGAQLENIINEATILSVRENTNVITLQQIDEAIDRVVAGPAKKHRIITKKELAITAYHEAGHAVLGLTKAYTFDVDKITIVPRGNAGGYNLMTPKEEKYNYSKSELEAKIMSFMGGRAAEQVIYGKGEVSTGASNDIEKATAIARAMVTQYGMSKLGPITYEKDLGPQYIGFGGQNKEYSDALAEQIDNAVRELILKAEAEAIKTIENERELLELIAQELLENETIVREQIQYIYKYRQRPSKKEKIDVIKNNDKFTKKDLEKLLSNNTTNTKNLPKKTSTKTTSSKENKTTKKS